MTNYTVEINKNENSNLVPLIKLPCHIPTQELSNSELLQISANFFQNNGVLQINNLFSQQLINNLYQAFCRSYQSYFEPKEYADALEVGDKRRMITIDVAQDFNNPDLYANPYLLNLMQKLLGKDVILGSYGVVIALPGAQHQHVHRDHPSLFDDETIDIQLPSYAITVVIPLVNLTPKTGSTRVWKQSHRLVRSQKEFKMSASDVPYMSTGSCYLMDYQLVHGGTANTSDIVRPILYLIYYRPWFREIVNFEKQDRINITPVEYQKIPQRYRFLFSDLSVSRTYEKQLVNNRERAATVITEENFYEVDIKEQEQRLTFMAQSALVHYGLENYRLELIAHRECTTFSLEIPGAVTVTEKNTPYLANRYLLRIHRANYLSAKAVSSELQWLEALSNAGIAVPQPVKNRQHELATVLRSPGIPEPRVCTVTKWVHGVKNESLSVKAIGQVMARLHNHSANWQPPEGFERPKWDWQGLFGKGAGYSLNQGAKIWQLTPQPYRNLFQQVGDRFKAMTNDLGEDSSQFGLIHADLCAGNLLAADGQVRVIDFADCGYGYWVHDLAMFMSYYARNPQAPTYLKSLLQGYAEIRPLPVKQLQYIDTFMAAQQVSLALWRVNRSQDHPYFRSILPQALKEAGEYAQWFLDKCAFPSAI